MQSDTSGERVYSIGVMKLPVEGQQEEFSTTVDEVVERVDSVLTEGEVGLQVSVYEFTSPHLLPSRGSYSPLDFLQIGLTEKLERNLTLLVLITEVELDPRSQGYALAYPSQLTNIAIVSTKRLDPAFWGEEERAATFASRLESLILHTVGHLLNVPHDDDPESAMYAFRNVADLDAMHELNEHQLMTMKRNLPREARDRLGRGAAFHFSVLLENLGQIARTVLKANPLKLALALPTVFTAGFSATLVMFFSSEIWDVASSVELYQLGLFSLLTVSAASTVLFRAFTLQLARSRGRLSSESLVVARVVLLVTLLLTVVVLFAAFLGLAYLGVISFFPRSLMETWTTSEPATSVLDHLKVSLFLAASGVLIGSLGSGGEQKDAIRTVLFLDEET